MKKFYIEERFEVLPEDKKNMTNLGVWWFLTGGSFIAFEIIAQSLFLEHFTSTNFSYVLIASGILSLFFYLSVERISLHVSFKKLLVFIPLIIIALSVSTYFLWFNKDLPYYYLYPFVLSLPLNYFIFYAFHKSLGHFLSKLERKRVGRLYEGLFLGGIFITCFLVMGLIFIVTSPLHILFLSTFFGVLSAIWFIVKRKHLQFYNESESKTIILEEDKEVKLRAPFLKYILAYAFLAAVAYYLLQYNYFYTISETFRNAVGYIKFLSLFTGALFAFVYFVKHFLIRRIILSYDSPYSLILVPLIIIFLLITIVATMHFVGYDDTVRRFTFLFIFIMLLKIIYFNLLETIEWPSIKQLLKIFSRKHEVYITSLLLRPLRYGGILFIGALLFPASLLFEFSPLHVFYAMLVLVALKLFYSVKMLQKFRVHIGEFIKNKTKRKGHAVIKYIPLKKHLYQLGMFETNQEVLYFLHLSEEIYPIDFRNSIRQLLLSPNKTLQKFAIEKVREKNYIEAIPQLRRIKDKEKNTELADSLAWMVHQFQYKVEPNLKPEKIQILAGSKLVQERLMAAQLLRYVKDDSLLHTLIYLLKDYDKNVKKAALLSSASFAHKRELLPFIVEYFFVDDYTAFVYHTIQRFKNLAVDYLDNLFLDKNYDEVQLLRILRVYGEIGGETAIKSLLNKLDSNSREIVYQAIFSLKQTGYVALKSGSNKILDAIVRTCNILSINLNVLYNIRQYDDMDELREALSEDIEFNYDILYDLLGLAYNPNLISYIRWLAEDGDGDDNSFAIELIDDVVDESLKPVLFPLIKHVRLIQRLRELEYFFPLGYLSINEVISEILTAEYGVFSVWTRVVCLETIKDEEIIHNNEVRACLFNPGRIIQEAAARKIAEFNQDFLDGSLSRMDKKDAEQLMLVLNETGLYSITERIKFLRLNPHLRTLRTPKLIYLAYHLQSSDEQIFSEEFLNFILQKPFLFFHKDQFQIKIKGKPLVFLHDVSMLDMEMAGNINNITSFKPLSGSRFYHIEKHVLKRIIIDMPELEISLQKMTEEIYKFNDQLPENYIESHYEIQI